MLDTERELQKLGVPVKTRHNEVAPNQYELAPIFENSNVGADHQQLTMQIMQNVARRYGLICLLHEKPFAGVNGSGKHNNWSMGTDDGENLLEPGDTPHENLQFLFFCAAVIQAVNKHQGLLRASIASPGQDHRLGANEAPPAIISIFLGTELEKVFNAIEHGEVGESTPESFLGLGTPVLPPLPMHGGDRNRTSPFAFTGNKFEFRALGSSMSLSLPNTVLNTIVAEAIDYLAEELEDALEAGDRARGGAAADPAAQLRGQQADRVRRRQLLRGVACRGRAARAAQPPRHARTRCRTSIADDTVTLFSNYGVLSQRELESRYEVFLEQYVTKLNIEAETAAAIARTMLLPAAARHSRCCSAPRWPELASRGRGAGLRASWTRSGSWRAPTWRRTSPTTTLLKHAEYMRDTTVPAMEAVREARRTSSRRSWPTTCGRCRSTPRSCSSSSAGHRSGARRPERQNPGVRTATCERYAGFSATVARRMLEVRVARGRRGGLPSSRRRAAASSLLLLVLLRRS